MLKTREIDPKVWKRRAKNHRKYSKNFIKMCKKCKLLFKLSNIINNVKIYLKLEKIVKNHRKSAEKYKKWSIITKTLSKKWVKIDVRYEKKIKNYRKLSENLKKKLDKGIMKKVEKWVKTDLWKKSLKIIERGGGNSIKLDKKCEKNWKTGI